MIMALLWNIIKLVLAIVFRAIGIALLVAVISLILFILFILI